jgi:hypothetical protein
LEFLRAKRTTAYDHLFFFSSAQSQDWPLATMDIALELCDTFFFDYAYSYILPAQPAPYLMQNGFGNSTVEALKVASSWQYTPASKYLSFTPRDAAWMSQLPRDNAYRQFFSLFLIMWYVLPQTTFCRRG